MKPSKLSAADIERYVDAAAAANGLSLSGAQRAQVILYFSRSAELAQTLLSVELPPDVEMAPVFRP